jgi:diguanylate cyclase (GGDEF)-like protein
MHGTDHADGARVSADLPTTTSSRQPARVPPARAGSASVGTPDLLAGFEILAELGRGAQSTVYRVRRPAGDSSPAGDGEYALKILDNSPTDSAATLVAFHREAALLATVNHPGLSGVHEVGVSAGRPYLVMDIVEGVSLAARLADGPLSAASATGLALDLVDPLIAIHHRGLVHRDLKPANIMIQADGTARLIDFGLTAREADTVDPQATAVGTLTYAPPEQSGMLKRPVDNRSDLYSLGVILFEAVTGRAPFSAADVGELLRMHAVMPAPDVTDSAPDTPPALAAVIAKLLAKDPDDRYQRGEDLAADLRDLPTPPGRTATATVVERRDGISGRAVEQAALAARWATAKAGRGSVAVLRGGGGTGKSLLATDLAGRVRAGGGTVLRGTASADDPVPFAPLRAAIEDHLRSVSRLPVKDRWRQRAGIRAACEGWSTSMLGRLAPGLEAMLNGRDSSPTPAAVTGPTLDLDAETSAAGAVAEGPDSQDQFAAAVAGFIVGLARECGSLLLILDDVQWLDRGSRRVLAQLSGQLAGTGLLVLVTARDDVSDGAKVEAFVAAMDGSVELDLTLPPLDEAAVAAQLRGLIPGLAVDAGLAALLTVRSNGNPFIVQEYLRAVVDAGLLRPAWGNWVLDEAGLDALELPQDALGLVITRVHGLAAPVRAVLTVAAAIGSRFRASTIAAVQDEDRPVVLAALATAVGRGLIEPRDDLGFAFLHDRIRQALLADLDPEVTADLHRRIADVLDAEPAPPGGHPAEHVYAVAHHYMQCDPDVASDRAFAACWAAGRLALDNHAPAEAVAFLESAVERTADLPSGFLLMVGTALMRAGRLLQARECLEQALQEETVTLRRAEIYTMLAEVYRSNWNTDAALTCIDAALAELGAALPRTRLGLLLSTALVFVLGVVKGWVGFGSARGPARERCAAICSLHQVGAYVGVIGLRPDLVLTHSLRLPYWANQLGPGSQYALSRRGVGFVYANLGLHRRARRAFARADADPSHQDPAEAAQTAHYRGAAAFLSGHDNGQDWVRDTETIGPWLDVATYLDAAAIFTLNAVTAGRTREAEHWLAQGRRRLSDRTDDVTSFVGSAAITYAMLGRSGEAGAELRRMNDLCHGHTALSLTVVRLITTVYVLVEQGELGAPFEQAVAEYEALDLDPARMLRAHRVINYQIALGRLAQLRTAGPDDRSARLAAARGAVRLVGRYAGPDELRARSLLVRADLMVLVGDPKAALGLLAGIDLFQDPDAPLVAYEVARVRARALAGLGSEESRRQARLAAAIAADQHWPHRAAAAAIEFALTPVERGGSSSLQPSQAGPHSGLERQRLQALQQVSAAASRVLDPGELARIALDETIRILAADRAFLFLTDPLTGGLVGELGRDADGQDVPELTGYSTTLVERVRVTGQPLVVTGTEEGAALGAASVVLHGLRSILVAPLQLEGRLLGIVYLDSQVAKGIFTADDAGILTALTNHIATSLETARAAQLEITVQTAQRQRDLAERLRSTLQSMSDTFDPEEVIWRLLDSARRVIGCTGVWLLSYDHEQTGVIRLMIDPVTIEVTRAPVTVDAALTALIDSGRPTIGTPDLVPAALQAELADATSWMTVPMKVQDGRTGIMVLASNRANVNLGDSIEVAAVIGAQGMTAYDKAVLFKQVQELAVVDELTSIANRRRFFEIATRDLAAARRHDRQLTVLMVDIDHFKRVNDAHGHATGDDVIRIVAGRLAEQIRQTDVIGRYGGEEFALLLQDAGPGNLLPERLRASIADAPIETRTGPLKVTVSIGLAYREPDDADIEALLSRADKELYRAKELGRNRVCG